MQYYYKGKPYTINNDEIDKIMDNLDVSLAEACELWLTDHDFIVNETIEDLTSKAKKNRITQTIHGAKGKKKEQKPRIKKENPLKKEIIHAIFDNLEHLYDGMAQISIRNDEKYIDFNLDGRDFTINLVEHRKKKG